ncbi:hypothetical protein [Streptacidiphilus albus]|uniref:hypothetical protein n=1 Tax=Streptacidiphilus albus TaxID=105425 RepID=UPI0012E00BAA|nr:hypothetical protein [Streptacidiphilus albus]
MLGQQVAVRELGDQPERGDGGDHAHQVDELVETAPVDLADGEHLHPHGSTTARR